MGKAAKQEKNRRRRQQKLPRKGIKLILPWRATLDGHAYYECSRFAVHHRHSFKLGAWLCGRLQYWYHKLTGGPLYYDSNKR